MVAVNTPPRRQTSALPARGRGGGARQRAAVTLAPTSAWNSSFCCNTSMQSSARWMRSSSFFFGSLSIAADSPTSATRAAAHSHDVIESNVDASLTPVHNDDICNTADNSREFRSRVQKYDNEYMGTLYNGALTSSNARKPLRQCTPAYFLRVKSTATHANFYSLKRCNLNRIKLGHVYYAGIHGLL